MERWTYNWFEIGLSGRIKDFIIQHIVTLPKYGHDALDIRNRYPAVYVASYVGKEVKWENVDREIYKDLGCFVINLLNNKTIILLNLAEYRLILADSAYGLVGQVSDDIPRDFAG